MPDDKARFLLPVEIKPESRLQTVRIPMLHKIVYAASALMVEQHPFAPLIPIQ